MNAIQEIDRWNQLRAAGVLPSVTSVADYTKKSTAGLAAAQVASDALIADNPPDPFLIRELHNVAFADVAPFAGSFRKDNGVMIGGYHGADVQRLSYEVALLNRQFREMRASDDSPNGRAAAAAFYHARLMRIHPFRDGNGRIGRTILSTLCDNLLGVNAGKAVMEAISADKPAYFQALQAANRHDLSPLTRLIGRSANLAIPATIPSPYRVAPLFRASYEDTIAADELAESRLTI